MKKAFLAVTLLALLVLGTRDLQAQAYGPYYSGPYWDAIQYQQYQQYRADNRLAKESLETADMYQDAEMQWSVWGGWDAGFGSFGPMGGPGPY